MGHAQGLTHVIMEKLAEPGLKNRFTSWQKLPYHLYVLVRVLVN